MVSLRLSLLEGQVDAFEKALHEFVQRLERESDDFVFLQTERAGCGKKAVFEISTGREQTLTDCLDHVQGALHLPVSAQN
ncbi:hypothetical protein GCM10011367_21210 [Marinicauda pacifica]|jgi:hypothetical protein|nr:hypothetical protein GCM10011367_21210 [Marinicauda pacifica]